MIAEAHAAGECKPRNGCVALEVSLSGYRAWCRRKKQGPSQRQHQDALLTERIVAIDAESGGVYGGPRIHAALRQAGVACSKHRVARLMREAGVRSRRASKRRHGQTTDSNHSLPVAENLLARDFTATAPDQKWVADITYIPTQQGWCYLAVKLDLYSRKVVGWALSNRCDRELVIHALKNALEVRKPPQLLHSDRGVQYASRAYQQELKAAGIQCSMSRPGECHDNAVAESFFASLKGESLPTKRSFANLDEARRAIFAYIDGFYNRRRYHSTLGQCSPDAFEAAGAASRHSVLA